MESNAFSDYSDEQLRNQFEALRIELVNRQKQEKIEELETFMRDFENFIIYVRSLKDQIESLQLKWENLTNDHGSNEVQNSDLFIKKNP